MKTKFFMLASFAFATHIYAGSATWSAAPISGDWTTATNWTPATVPNGSADTATFAPSKVTDVSLSAGVEVDGIVFDPGADGFTISNTPGVVLTISGAGITNSSSLLQYFVNQENDTNSGELYFTHGATAGDSVVYTNESPFFGGRSPLIQFEDSATAGSAQFMNLSGGYFSSPGQIEFQGNSTAASATFRNSGAGGGQEFPTINFRDQASAGQAVFSNEATAGGFINFFDNTTADHASFTNGPTFISGVIFYNNSTAGNATFINEGASGFSEGFTSFEDASTAGDGYFVANGALAPGPYGSGSVNFFGNANAGNGNFVANGGEVSSAIGGLIVVYDSATAANGVFCAYGGMVSGAFGGRVKIEIGATAGTARLIAKAGIGAGEGEGGGIVFNNASTGDNARVELLGNGFLDLRGHDAPGLTVGSLEGDGLVFLGNANLSIGSNNLSTSFAGLIEEASAGLTGALTKVGRASLTLTGANTYSGGTTIEGGKLVVNNRTGSGTGSGPVQVNTGRLGGRGMIAGNVILGTGSGPGATLAPGQSKGRQNTLTLQSALTFNSDGAYECGVNSKGARADKVIANGITINGGRFALRDARGFLLTPGTVLTVIDNTAAIPINGLFANLPDDSTFAVGNNTYQADYQGGDGNNLTLTVVP